MEGRGLPGFINIPLDELGGRIHHELVGAKDFTLNCEDVPSQLGTRAVFDLAYSGIDLVKLLNLQSRLFRTTGAIPK